MFGPRGRPLPKTLRHYDSVGLLRPATTDEWSGVGSVKFGVITAATQGFWAIIAVVSAVAVESALTARAR